MLSGTAISCALPCLAFSSSDTHISFFVMLAAYMTLRLFLIPQMSSGWPLWGPGMAKESSAITRRIAATAAKIIVNDLIGEISLNAKQHTIDLES